MSGASFIRRIAISYLAELLDYLPNILNILLLYLTIDKDIIDKYSRKIVGYRVQAAHEALLTRARL